MSRSARMLCAVILLATTPCADVVRAADVPSAPTSRAKQTGDDYQNISRMLDRGEANDALTALDDRGVTLSRADHGLLAGRALLMLNRVSAARREIQTAIRQSPKRAESHFWLGRVYQSDGAHSLASMSFQRAYSLGLDSADLHLHWAMSLRASDATLGDIRQTDWKSQTSSSPLVGDFVRDGIVVRDVRGRPDRVIIAPPLSAVFQIEKARSAAVDRPDILLLAGELWAGVDQHVRAVRMYRDALAGFGESADATKRAMIARCHGGYAVSALALGRLETYLSHSRREMELSAGIDAARLAGCYEAAAREASARGSLARQIRYLTMASELQATPARLMQLADTLLVAHRTEDAHQCLTRAMDARPTREERVQIRSRLARTSFLSSPPARQ